MKIFNLKNNHNQQENLLDLIELNALEVSQVSGGSLASPQDDIPHGLGCGCSTCRRDNPAIIER